MSTADPKKPNKGEDDPKEPKGEDQNGAEPGKSDEETQETKNLTEEQWEIAFNHSRFKKLAQDAQELKELKEKQKQDEEERLKENQKWEELATKREEELKKLKDEVIVRKKQAAIINSSLKFGISDTDAAVKLINSDEIEIDEEGEIQNVDTVVEKLAKDKPYLVSGQPAQNIGAPSDKTTPAKPGQIYKVSELREKMKDPVWFEKNEEEIQKAQKEGRIQPD